MPSSNNNDRFFRIILGLTFAFIAIVLLVLSISQRDFSSLWESEDNIMNSSSRLRGVSGIFFIILGLASGYFAIKSLLKKRKNDT